MPPRKGPRNVVKSGNAGNSSKASPLPSKVAATIESNHKKDPNAKDDAPPAVVRPPPLFPVGYKSPVTLLNERCQKEGWDRPIVDSVRLPLCFPFSPHLPLNRPPFHRSQSNPPTRQSTRRR